MGIYIPSEINMSIMNRSDIFSEFFWNKEKSVGNWMIYYYTIKENPPRKTDIPTKFAENWNIILAYSCQETIVIPWVYAETAIF